MQSIEQINLERLVEKLPLDALTELDRLIQKRLFQENELTETEYLLKSPANAAHLEKSIEEYKAGKILVRDIIDE